MGESFMGLPNRFRLIGRDSDGTVADKLALEYTYNPDHALSAYYGYRISREYVSREGGKTYAMQGHLYTKALIPVTDGNYLIGSPLEKYAHVYANNLHGEVDGNASSATVLKNPRTITVKLISSKTNNTGKASFDGSDDITINVDTPYLPLTGGTLSGGLYINSGSNVYKYTSEGTPCEDFYGLLTAGAIIPKTTTAYNIGSYNLRFNTVYANNFYGNANTATKLSTSRNIIVGSCTRGFDGSSDISFPLSEIGACAKTDYDTLNTTVTNLKTTVSTQGDSIDWIANSLGMLSARGGQLLTFGQWDQRTDDWGQLTTFFNSLLGSSDRIVMYNWGYGQSETPPTFGAVVFGTGGDGWLKIGIKVTSDASNAIHHIHIGYKYGNNGWVWSNALV